MQPIELVLILHDIRSVHNVGSLFRTADGAGIARIILSGCTPTPIDRFGRERQDFAKVSLGAEKTMPWSYADDIHLELNKLKEDDHTIAALEQDARSTSLLGWRPENGRVALILGNEVGGVAPELLDRADVILEIPMYGLKESLNVSVAGGIALFSIKF